MALFTKKSKYPDRVKDLELVVKVFEQHGVRAILCYGGLLGMVRDGDFLEHDDPPESCDCSDGRTPYLIFYF